MKNRYFPKGNQYWKLRDQKKLREFLQINNKKKEFREKISNTMKKNWKNKKYRSNQIESFSKRPKPTKESNLKRSKTLKGKISPTKGMKFTNEINKKKGRFGKENAMSRPEIKQKHLNACRTYGKQWKGGISFEPYNKDFNSKFKRLIRKRDNCVCLKCGKHQEKNRKSLCIHHINYDKKLSIPQNCCSLCFKCHSEINWNRSHWLKFFQFLLSEKYKYDYSKENNIIMVIK